MSPRRARRRGRPPPKARPLNEALRHGEHRHVEHHRDGDWFCRPVAGSAAGKVYRCPGCDQAIPPGTPHTVAWPADALTDRRHWHTACWGARERRTVKVHRSKNAPRYG